VKTLFWHDYETSGADPRRDRPMQFAGQRTDLAFNVIDDPLVLYCRPALDCLPRPEACLLTGITPQTALEKGVIEPEFIARVHHALSHPGTCAVGYNTLRFDDEITRHTLYRNFFDPYGREWQHGNSRWDIIDLARMCYALRPEGINWPTREDGSPSFRLEALASANGLLHESAHDALSDVHATIALARLIRDRQPRLYQWLFELRDKRRARALLDLVAHTPVVHTSGRISSTYACTSLIMPLAAHPTNGNAVLCYDLRFDPTPFLDLDEASLHQRLFTSSADLGEGVQRLPVKSIRVNMCPALAPERTLDAAAVERVGLDLDDCARNRERVLGASGFADRIVAIHRDRPGASDEDVDAALYAGFLNDGDRALAARARATTAERLSEMHFDFADARMPELLFRYRARNWPDTLNEAERERWAGHRQRRLAGEADYLSLEEYRRIVKRLRVELVSEEDALSILDALDLWGERVSET